MILRSMASRELKLRWRKTHLHRRKGSPEPRWVYRELARETFVPPPGSTNEIPPAERQAEPE